MELDKKLFDTLLKTYNESGPPPNCAYAAIDFAGCPESQKTVAFLYLAGRGIDDPLSSIGAALQVGFEVGLQYAELTRQGVKP
jgi:hypothetical protein